MKENITYTVTQEIGVISRNDNGNTKEVNLVVWNDQEAKLDIRNWSPNRERYGKGIIMTIEEEWMLLMILQMFYSRFS